MSVAESTRIHSIRIGRKLLLLAATLSFSVAAENRIDTQRPNAPDLAAYGSYEIGTRPLTLVNPDQVNVLALDAGGEAPETLPLYDRELEVQMWYPSFPGATGSKTLRVFLRDPAHQIALEGQATLWASPIVNDGPFPLVIISHGYPGNRFLLSHLADNIASKGYVVVSIDHTDSTYRTQDAFGSTLRNRSIDQLFVLDEMTRLNADPSSFLYGLIDTDNSAVIGYSMGGYGAVITAGGGVTAASVDFAYSPPFGTLDVVRSGSDSHNAMFDPRIKTAIAFAPWGRNVGFFDAETLKGVRIPMLFFAGDEDDVSLYEGGIRSIWEESVNVDRALMTFENVNHNSGAPYLAPAESYVYSENLGRFPFSTYADPVWDTVRLNNVAQHFSTAWLDLYLKGDTDKQSYLDLIPDSNEGVYATADDGSFTEAHTYWKGFEARTAMGMHFEMLKKGEAVTE